MNQMNGEAVIEVISTDERKRRKLVRRSHFMTILAAWLITVPATALLSALLFFALNAMKTFSVS
jgi:PiT family inorganic phosphate transporter